MSVYRDEHERCPRCGTDLTQAGSVRACTSCRGMWVQEDILITMAANMFAPPKRAPVPLVPQTRQPLPCPSCREAMATWTLHAIAIDRCAAHGLWFDRDELQIVLRAIGDPTYRRRLEDR
jgi:Zn-finger nucleic acid-binding protein